MERVAGIEPAQSAWKAEVLPLNTMSAYGVLSGIRTREGFERKEKAPEKLF